MASGRQTEVVEGALIARSRAVRKVLALAKRVAQSDAPVLLTGESGSGKERVVRYIHASSRRARGEFVAVNCAALPEQLLESELFGHVRGAFTGADREKKGLIEAAGGGQPAARRDRRDPARGAGEALARAPGPRGSPRRRHREHAHRRAHPRGHAPRPDRDGARARLPPGPLLPSPGACRPAPAA